MSELSDLIGRLRERSALIDRELGAGKVSTWDSYNRLVGENHGIQFALAQINEILRSEDD